jgi:hypothetical protein
MKRKLLRVYFVIHNVLLQRVTIAASLLDGAPLTPNAVKLEGIGNQSDSGHALLVQLVERRSPKPDVGGSSPPGRA